MHSFNNSNNTLNCSNSTNSSSSIMLTSANSNSELNGESILQYIPEHILIPPYYITLLACISYCICNILFNILSTKSHAIVKAFDEWTRILHISTISHIIAPSVIPNAPVRSVNGSSVQHHANAESFITTPSSTEDAALAATGEKRGIAAFTNAEQGTINCSKRGHRSNRHVRRSSEHITDPLLHNEEMERLNTTAANYAYENVDFFRDIERRDFFSDERPPPTVPAPVVTEALTNSLDDVRRESQRLIITFHPYFVAVSAVKALCMLIYIQFYFHEIDGGWERMCVCGTANIMAGLLTPVLEYATNLLLPLDISESEASVALEEEGPKDSAFIAELLLSIARLQLNDLMKVLLQGSTFVIFAAVLVPMLIIHCAAGILIFPWVFIVPWIIYLLIRFVYYHHSLHRTPSTSSRRSVAILLFSWEMIKTFLMKVVTLLILLLTIQVSLLIGLAFIETHSYVGALRYEWVQQITNVYHVRRLSVFQEICLASQLFFERKLQGSI